MLALMQADRLLPSGSDSAGAVLTLHHVRPDSGAAFQPNAGLCVQPEFLDALLGRLAETGRRFVPLSKILDDFEAGRAAPEQVAITLDDGYRDNLEEALPVFRRHDAFFTLFACPGFCDRTAPLWWEALERILADNQVIAAEGHGPPEMAAATLEEKSQAFTEWSVWLLRVSEGEARAAVEALAARYGLDLAALARELVMDWDELRVLAAEPLATIGAHTDTHPALARLSPERALEAMRSSADRLEAELGERPGCLAFPYGTPVAVGEREARIAKDAGFRAAFTTRPGMIRFDENPHFLPRISVNGLYQEVRLQEVLLSPGLWRAGRGALSGVRRLSGGRVHQ
ncbi:polysaccharide deacetylase [Afifella sp. IM 167]|nr:polysaccharide deacetylase [Afifella sp. IM 167]